MKTFRTLLWLALVAVLPLSWGQNAVETPPDALPAEEAAPPAEPSTLPPEEGIVVICPLEEMVDDGMAELVKRTVEEWQTAKAIVFEIDTPGGLIDSAVNITESILDARPTTIAYIKGMGAISAGALISFSCDHIIMEPGTNIGDAAPVYVTPEGAMPTGEKEVSYMRSRMRTLAEINGHNPAIAMAMVDKDMELRAVPLPDGSFRVYSPDILDDEYGDALAPEGTVTREYRETDPTADKLVDIVEGLARELTGTKEEPEEEEIGPQGYRIICARGKLLTLSTQEAKRYGVIPTDASTLDQALAFYELDRYHRLVRDLTPAEALFRWLTNPAVSGILLLIGLAGLYMEFQTPGFGFAGILGLVALALFFGPRAVLGLADWIDIGLLIIGLLLLAAEIFVLPGFGIAGVAGMACILAGIIMSFTLDGFTIPQYEWDFARLADAGKALSIAVIAFAVFAAVMWQLLPRTPLRSFMVLGDSQDAAAGYVVQDEVEEAGLIGQRGVAISMLRPAGRVRIGEKTYHVVSRAEFLGPGTAVIVTQVEGNRLVVEPVKEDV